MSFFRLLRRDSQINGSELQCGISMPSEHPRKIEGPNTLHRLALLAGLALSPSSSQEQPPPASTVSRTESSSHDESVVRRLRQHINTRSDAPSAVTDSATEQFLGAEDRPASTPAEDVGHNAVSSLYNPANSPEENFRDIGGYIQGMVQQRFGALLGTEAFRAEDLATFTRACTGAAYQDLVEIMEGLEQQGKEEDALELDQTFRSWDPNEHRTSEVQLPTEGSGIMTVTAESDFVRTPTANGEEEAPEYPAEEGPEDSDTLDPTLAQR